MKIALLIHAHTNPKQVARLVSRLLCDDVDIYINVDGKADIVPYKDLIREAIFLKNRVEVVWGRFSQVQQILNSFSEILSSEQNYSHILFISGQDYPVLPINDIVQKHRDKVTNNFISYYKLGNDNWSLLMKKRYEYWHFLPNRDLRNNKYVKKLFRKLGFKRKYPFVEAYYGACWFSLTLDSVRYLLKFTNENPHIVKFFQHSGCADELYIQSVLLNSNMKNNMINNIYRYFDWGDNGKSPKILTKSDFPLIKDSDAWFARKVDGKDIELLDLLDQINSH
ncbi:beta-1,6-N-acetylglucosaminyltransferase [Dysgonomonas capnocytophagoides]|uniref:beta-1,6-N-acetylglucosaminyltransferase n=1 Tax=Dysgonomonas capnocytophagoides TaxID=45254 RepID=UPI003341BED1